MVTPPQVVHGDCLEIMKMLPDDSVDSIVTDPPYGLGFMGKAWDALPPGLEWAAECLRVLKPGGHLLAFGGTRTWHRLALSIEDAGFEIRDSIAWIHSEGFPKHRTGLKPAFEPIVMARKPFKGSLAANEAAHGTGALDIDGCRISSEDSLTRASGGGGSLRLDGFSTLSELESAATSGGKTPTGRDAAATLARFRKYQDSENAEPGGRWPANVAFDEAQASTLQSKFFYVAKAAKAERPVISGVTHATVKPLALMRWLVRLATPNGGTVLEPFAGSGTTVEACILEELHCIAIEKEAEYIPLIQARIDRQEAA